MPDWKLRERVVAALEKAVAPGSTVLHDQRLPVIGSPSKRTRQCDVVVLAGSPPRQTIAIVEVQKRNRPVELSQFESWLVKRSAVGAHQLFCVSQHPYPQSVIEEARKHGQTVKLLTLDPDRQGSGMPVTMVGMISTNYKFDVVEFPTGMRLEPLKLGAISVVTTDPILSVDEEFERISLNDLLMRITNNDERLKLPPHSPPTDVTFDLGRAEGNLWFWQSDQKRLVKRWEVKVRLTVETTEAPMTLSNVPYEEHGLTDPLAWVSQAIMPLDGENRAVTLALRTRPEGGLQFQLDTTKVDGPK